MLCAVSISASCAVSSVGAVKTSVGKQEMKSFVQSIDHFNFKLDLFIEDISSLLDKISKLKDGVDIVQYKQKLTSIYNYLNDTKSKISKLRNDDIILDDENFVSNISKEFDDIISKFSDIKVQTLHLSEELKTGLGQEKNLVSLCNLCVTLDMMKTNVENMEAEIDKKKINISDSFSKVVNEKNNTESVNKPQVSEDLKAQIDAIYNNRDKDLDTVCSETIDLLKKYPFSDKKQRAIEAARVICTRQHTGKRHYEMMEQFIVPVLHEELTNIFNRCCKDGSEELVAKLKKEVNLDDILKDIVSSGSKFSNFDDMMYFVLFGPSGFYTNLESTKEHLYKMYMRTGNERWSPVILDILELQSLAVELENMGCCDLKIDRVALDRISKRFMRAFSYENRGSISGIYGYLVGKTHMEDMIAETGKYKGNHPVLNELFVSFQEVVDDMVTNNVDLSDMERKKKISIDLNNLKTAIDSVYEKYARIKNGEISSNLDEKTKTVLEDCRKQFVFKLKEYDNWRSEAHKNNSGIYENGDWDAVGANDAVIRENRVAVIEYYKQNRTKLDVDKVNKFTELANKSIREMDSFQKFHNKYIQLQKNTFGKYLKWCGYFDMNLKLSWSKFWEMYGEQLSSFDCSKVEEFIQVADQVRDGVEKFERENGSNITQRIDINEQTNGPILLFLLPMS